MNDEATGGGEGAHYFSSQGKVDLSLNHNQDMAKGKQQPGLESSVTAVQLAKRPLPNSDTYLTINKLLNHAALKGAWSGFSRQAERGLLQAQNPTSSDSDPILNNSDTTKSNKGKESAIEVNEEGGVAKFSRTKKSSSFSSTLKKDTQSTSKATVKKVSVVPEAYNSSRDLNKDGRLSGREDLKESKVRQSMRAQSLKDVEDAKRVARKSVLSL